jgi:hypothetical protein
MTRMTRMMLTGRTAAFGRRRTARRRAAASAAAFAVATAVIAGGAQAGIWFVPFLIGLAAGAGPVRLRRALPLAVLAAVAGWAIPLWVLALRGLPAGATAREIAGLAGLPPHAAVTVLVTLALAALQVLAAAWLVRALLRRPVNR